MSIVILDTGKLQRLDPDWENAGGMFPRDDGDFVRFDGLKTNVDLAELARRINIEISLREDGYKGVYAIDVCHALRKLEP